ncbi:MAG: LacI family transcriptional regulator, partial [Reinekea sp.]
SSVASGLEGTRFHLNVTPYSPQDDLMKPVRYIVETGSADAIILNQIEPEDVRIAYLMDRKFPFATHGRSNWAESHPYYDFDNGAFGQLAIDLLASRGRKSVLAIAPPLRQSYGLHLVNGLQVATDANHQTLHVLENSTSDDPSDTVIEHVTAYLKAHPETDAIVAASTTTAMAAVAALESLGKTVGREIDVLSKEATPFLQLFRAEILSMSEAVGEAGDFLAKAAIQAVREPDLPPMQFLEVPEAP